MAQAGFYRLWWPGGADIPDAQGAGRAAALDHAHTLAGATPILALDMYEHSYQMDYGAKAGAYVEAFMHNIHWHKVPQRYTRCARAV